MNLSFIWKILWFNFFVFQSETEPINRDSNFCLFAAMNPASDIGKKNLPQNIRNRFTEIFVDELTDKNDLVLLINDYLRSLNPSTSLINKIADFYIELKLKNYKKLSNSAGLSPTFTLRSLCRGNK